MDSDTSNNFLRPSKSNNNLRLIPPSSQRDGAGSGGEILWNTTTTTTNNNNNNNNNNNRQNEDELEYSSGGTRIKRVLSNLSISIRSWTNKGTSESSRVRRPNSRNATGGSSTNNNIKYVSEEKRDENRLYASLEDAGRIADGVCAVEVWILDRNTTGTNQGAVMLVQPPGGFWSCPDFIPDDYDALSRIEDKEKADYEHAHPLLPGTGLAGTLWNDRLHSVEDGDAGKKKRNADLGTILKRKRAMMLKPKPLLPIHTPLRKSFQSMTNLHANYDYRSTAVAAQAMNTGTTSTDGFTWRHMESILADPYQPTFRRLALMEEAGFSKCAGIHFDIQGTEGILLFFANEEIPTSRLNAADNVDYMRAATNLVGSAAAMALRRIRLSARLNSSLPTTNTNLKTGHHIYNHVTTYIGKLHGGNLQPPTSMPMDEALLTFIGVFLTLLTLHFASGWIEETTGSGFILGPFGALMTLQFGLTMAPVGQPRNIIFGQTIATTVGVLFLSIPESHLHRYLRISLATATAIAGMVKLGVAHPPAGASVLIISSGGYGWNILPPVLLSNLIAIVMSTLVNNLSEKRQYPTYFHLGEKFLSDALFGCCAPEGDLSFAINESVKLRRATSILKEANFLNNDGQKRETGIRGKSLSSKQLSISSGVSFRSVSVTADEDDGIGLDIFANEATRFFNPLSTRYEKNLDETSSNQNEAIMIDEEGSTTNRSSDNLTSKIPSRHSQLTLLSPLEEVENRSCKKQAKPPQMHYGSMFMVPMSLRQDLEREEEDMDDGGASQESSDLEDMIFS